ncbi:MAG: cytochrome c [Gammaproteobacteria bacterium]|nr:cytochrome c [Gammaproteobacteria bacterium]
MTHQLPREKLAAAARVELSRDDREYAEEINDTCAGCHGEFGEGSLDGEYPRLAGMNPRYLKRQIEHFKSRERLNLPMLPYATDRELPGEDIDIIVHYLASIDLPTELPEIEEESFNALDRLQQSKQVVNIARYPGNPGAGAEFYALECAACHGADAYGKADGDAPQLAGQHSVYLKRQIALFASAERHHDDPRDAEIFKAFGEKQIDDMLAWLSLADDAATRH